MQMDSYYAFQDEAPFFAHGLPPSPELPFGLIASPEPPLAPARQSAFQEYYCAGPELVSGMAEGMGRKRNIHRRVMDVLGRMEGGEREERRPDAVESSRGFRHMMRERQRREKLSQSYADLYAMVSSRSKVRRAALLCSYLRLGFQYGMVNGDKNSIVQSAAIYTHELKGARDQLQRKNEELKAKLLGHDAQQQCVKVQFEVDEPSSSIDSMIGALRRLKSMNVKTSGIRSDLSGHRLSTVMHVETTIASSEVEKAVEEALKEVERNQPDSDIPFPGSRGWSQTSHVQNVF